VKSAPVTVERTHTSLPGSVELPSPQMRKKLSRKEPVGALHGPHAKTKSCCPEALELSSRLMPSGRSMNRGGSRTSRKSLVTSSETAIWLSIDTVPELMISSFIRDADIIDQLLSESEVDIETQIRTRSGDELAVEITASSSPLRVRICVSISTSDSDSS